MSQAHPGRFPTTQWSLVGRAGQEGKAARQALAELLERYYPALKSHIVRRRGLAEDEAEDLLQGFLSSRVLEKNIVAQADRAKGRFRSFLLTVLDHYVANELRRKRPANLDSEVDLADPAAPVEDVFHQDWAREVIAAAIERMRQECSCSGRADIWGVFECRLLAPTLNESPPPPYEAMAATFGLRSPVQAANLVITGKRMFARVLRSVVAEYAEQDDVEAEIADLQKILSGGA